MLIAFLALAPGAAAAYDRPALRASVAACETGPLATERFAVFTASMPALPGTDRMRMRFDLYARARGERRYRRIQADAFGGWDRSRHGRSRFIYTKRVEALTPRVAYRAVVRFRWTDASGRVQMATRRTTRTCRPAEVRPDLRVIGFDVLGGGRYQVRVLNAGRRALSRPVNVVLTVAGTPQAAVLLEALEPGEEALIPLSGPQCPVGRGVEVAFDTTDELDEADETDNALGRLCPA